MESFKHGSIISLLAASFGLRRLCHRGFSLGRIHIFLGLLCNGLFGVGRVFRSTGFLGALHYRFVMLAGWNMFLSVLYFGLAGTCPGFDWLSLRLAWILGVIFVFYCFFAFLPAAFFLRGTVGVMSGSSEAGSSLAVLVFFADALAFGF